MESAAMEQRERARFEPIGDEAACLGWLWTTLYAPDGTSSVCTSCRTVRRFHRVRGRRAYACDHCAKQIYPAAGTFLEDSGLSLVTWFTAARLVMGNSGRIAPRALAQELRVSYKTALRMKKRIWQARGAGGVNATLLGRLPRTSASADDWADTDKRSTPRAPKARDNIRAAACRAIAEGGLANTRIADIAHEAGVSPAIIHYYFKSKDEVLLAAIQWALEQVGQRLREVLAGPYDHVERLRALIDEAVPQTDSLRNEYLLWLEVWPRTRHRPEVLAACVAMSSEWTEFVTTVVAEGVEAGVFTPVAPVEEIVVRIMALADGFAYRTVVGYEMMRVQRARRLLAGFAAEQLGVPVAKLAAR